MEHQPTNLSARNAILVFFIVSLTLFSLPGMTQTALTPDEIADLQFMREEEKMARDLYSAFYDLWGTDIFLNIGSAEQRHMDAVLDLLNRYNITDPASGQPEGSFVNDDLQALYDDLLSQGSDSVADALAMGIVVEETDIADLEASIAQTSLSPILRVYRNLLKGSENHLSAFSNRLQQLDPDANGGSSYGPGEGTSVYEPFSQTVYIPAIDVISKSGATVVYDAYLRVIESLPITLELLSISSTDKIPSNEHASYIISEAVLTIPSLRVGSQQVDSLNDSEYLAVFNLAAAEKGAIFILESLTPL